MKIKVIFLATLLVLSLVMVVACSSGELVADFSVDENGNLVAVYGDGSQKVIETPDVSDGAAGKDGVGIANAEINSKGELIVTLTDGATMNLGVVNGEDGKDGAPGKDGADGKDGAAGANGYNGLKGTGIESITYDETECVLTITLTNGTVYPFHCGSVGTGSGTTTDTGISNGGANVERGWSRLYPAG